MFEVGKKYKVDCRHYTCVMADDKGAVLEPSEGAYARIWENNFQFDAYKEYTPPKVMVTEANVHLSDHTGQMYTVLGTYPNALGRIRITHIEGQGLKVAVIG